jgi:hypothetical protein
MRRFVYGDCRTELSRRFQLIQSRVQEIQIVRQEDGLNISMFKNRFNKAAGSASKPFFNSAM